MPETAFLFNVLSLIFYFVIRIADYFVMSGIIFVICLCVLLTIFVPKIQVHHRKSVQLQGPKGGTAVTVGEQSAGDRTGVSNRSSGAHGADILSFETDRIKLIEDKARLQERVVELEEENQKLKEASRVWSEECASQEL